MALKLNVSLNALAAIKKIGIAQDQYDWLVAEEVLVKLTAEQFEFWLFETATQAPCMEAVPVKLDQLQKLTGGLLPFGEKMALAKSLSAVIQKLRTAVAVGALTPKQGVPIVPATPVSTKSDPMKLPPLPPSSDTAPVAEPEPKAPLAWPEFPQAKMLSYPTVMLRDATQMYQPVNGTSPGSRYFVVAGSNDVRVAARYTNKKLSVRIEGPGLLKFKKEVDGVGMTFGDASSYASMHLNADTHVIAGKALGAILMGLGIPMTSPLPNINVIAGK